MNTPISEAFNILNKDEMDGWRWSLECTKEDAFMISDLLSEIECPHATAVGIDELSPQTFRVQAYYLDEPDRATINQALELIGQTKALTDTVEILPVQKNNWVARSQENLNPVEAGCFIIHGSHDRAQIARKSRMAIEIDAAEAFGTAHHGTTRGCLKALDSVLKLRSPKHILDLGTGTGVLAIAAAKGTAQAKLMATDIDPIATRTADNNCKLNNVKTRVQTFTCAGFDHQTLRNAPAFELIIANILAAPLKRLSQKFHSHLAPGGMLILSGILTTQAKSVRATFRAHGFIDRAQIEDGEWSILTMQRGT